MDRGAWQATVHGVAKSRTRLSDFTITTSLPNILPKVRTHQDWVERKDINVWWGLEEEVYRWKLTQDKEAWQLCYYCLEVIQVIHDDGGDEDDTIGNNNS